MRAHRHKPPGSYVLIHVQIVNLAHVPYFAYKMAPRNSSIQRVWRPERSPRVFVQVGCAAEWIPRVLVIFDIHRLDLRVHLIAQLITYELFVV